MTPLARLSISLALVACVAVFEVWGGLRAQSLALLTDAAHVCMDAFALGVAMFAILGARRPPNARKTFGYGRLEILGALFNGSVLLAVTGFLVFEAIQRFSQPVQTHGALMSLVAAGGLCVNAAIALLLREHGKHDLNFRAALFHVMGDALGALAVIVGGAVIALTNAVWIDPALSIFVAIIIVVGVLRVIRDAADVLLEAVPSGLHVNEVREAIAALEGTVAVHDLHVWTIGSGALALSAHVLVEDRRVSEATAIARSIDALLRERYGITHVTLQFECESCSEDERVVCTQKRD
ncbi:MAG TPA: cation diffusion facilitator family transporter [Candidatus Baltobacteraceae bacterium]|nr:cation diffusion facilitator family transporter [Candidatus Baltobacteraceae bacterium]